MSDATAFTDHKKRKKVATRGKTSENHVKSYLEDRKNKLGVAFNFERIPDARAAGGRFTPVAGDFRCAYAATGRHAVIEVKEVETSKDRLPAKNFSRDKIGRAYAMHMAGALVVVLVHHVETGAWVVMPIEHFYDNVQPSWPTTGFPHFRHAQTALDFALQRLYS